MRGKQPTPDYLYIIARISISELTLNPPIPSQLIAHRIVLFIFQNDRKWQTTLVSQPEKWQTDNMLINALIGATLSVLNQ